MPSESESDPDEARDAVVPRPKRPYSMKPRKSVGAAPHSDSNGQLSEDHRWLSVQALLKHQSPYVSLDESVGYAYAPSSRASMPTRKTKEGAAEAAQRMSKLPNKTLNIDLRTLNLHLAIRAKEVIACSESMWEWVVEYQDSNKSDASGPRHRSASIETALLGITDAMSNGNTVNLTQNAILEMTRDDFDQLLNNFDM